MDAVLARKLLIKPVHFLRGEHVDAHSEEVAWVNGASSEAILYHQKARLCEIITAAAQSGIPFYRVPRRARKAGPAEILPVLEAMPLVSKEMLREVARSGRGRGFRLDLRSTSGSTGLPFRFYKDRLATGYMESVLYAAYAWHGIEIGDRQARFWGMPVGVGGKLLARTKDFLKNRIRFSAFDLSTEAKEAFWDRLTAFQPRYFYGYPSLIAEFCRFALETGRDLTSLPLKAVIGTGEFVHQKERELIRAATGVPFVSEYGCTEVGLIGFECRHGSMHVMASNLYVEVIKEGRNVVDKEGEIYVTELHSRHLPFVRYGIGDRGMLLSRSCTCGSKLPVLQVLSGRKDDYVITPEGKMIYDAIFAYVLKKGVDQFKAVQSAPDFIKVLIKPNRQYSAELEASYIRRLKKEISSEIEIVFEPVETIPRSKAGKLRYFERRFAGGTTGAETC